MQDFKEKLKEIEKYINELPASYVNPSKAQQFAVEFLQLKANAARTVMDLRESIGDLRTRSKVEKMAAWKRASGKTVEERRMGRDSDEEYMSAARDEELLEAEVEYAETLRDICGNYHIYYRQLADK